MRLKKNKTIKIKLETKEHFGGSTILDVSHGEEYIVTFSDKKTAKDLWYPSNPKGFFNPLVLLAKRVKKAKCFQLCGTINKNEDHHFPIQKGKSFLIPASGKLYFFANDSTRFRLRFYNNNKGYYEFDITRI